MMDRAPLTRLLLVEDNPGDARLVQAMLTADNPGEFSMTWVDRLATASTALARQQFDVILLDLSLPDEQGLETLAAVQTAAGHVPIVVMSGLEDESVAVSALQRGAQDYLVKGHVDGHLLMRAVRYAIERQRMEERIKHQERLYRLVANNSSDVVALHDLDGTLRYVSPSCQLMLGYPQEELLGTLPLDLVHPDDQEHVRASQTAVLAGDPSRIAYRMRRRTGEYIWVETLTRSVRDTSGKVVQLQSSSRDITERKAFEEQLAQQAFHDPLTQLPNRALFMDRLHLALSTGSRRARSQSALLFLDLDNFKLVNDSLGHVAGDQLLQAVGRRLQQFLRPGDTLARLGGDEFTILLEDIGDASDAVAVAERIAQQLETPFHLGEREVFITASIGIAVSAQPQSDPSSLLRDADVAMYRAKNQGKSRYAVFIPDMGAHVLERLELETHLRHAVDRDEFLVYYQPIVQLKTGRITGLEALVRWNHPRRGVLLPREFISLAEETGLILSIGERVLETACTQLRAWRHRYGAHLTMNVNLSAIQLQRPGLVDAVTRILQGTGVDPHLLKLEITESVLLHDDEHAFGTLRRLRELGVQAVVDDFGTGYSSLSYLKRFPFDLLKIDRSFVGDLGRMAEDAAIVRAVLTFARSLNMTVIAEGVESDEQLRLLLSMGCEWGQGFFFAEPLMAPALEQLLAAQPAASTTATLPFESAG